MQEKDLKRNNVFSVKVVKEKEKQESGRSRNRFGI